MKVKSVWGVVLIVLGVFTVISGFSQIADTQALSQTMDSFFTSIGTVGGASAREFEVAVRDARIGGWIKILVGICLAVLGTVLVKDTESVKRNDTRSYRTSNERPDTDEWRMK